MRGGRASHWVAVVLTLALNAAAGPATRPYLPTTLDTAGLIAVLEEPSWGSRAVELSRKRQACDRITAATPEAARAVPALIHLLHDGRAAPPAATALGRLGPSVADDLLAAAHDDDPTCRRFAVQALAGLPAAVVEPPLIDLSRTDPDPTVRRWATFALCDLKLPSAGPGVMALLGGDSRPARMETLDEIARWPLTDAVAAELAQLIGRDRDAAQTDRAAAVLVGGHPRFTSIAGPLCSMAGWGDGRAGEAAALQVLSQYPAASWGGLAVALRCAGSPDGQSQGFALRILQRAKPDEIGPWLFTLAALSQSRDPNVQRGNLAAVYVKACGDYAAAGPTDGPAADRTLGALEKVVADANLTAEAKGPALKPLSRFGPRARRAAPAVARMLAGVETDDRVAAAEFLTAVAPAGAVADAAAVAAVVRGPAAVRLAAERYLLAEPAEAVPLLPALIDDNQPDVRAAGLDLAGRLPAGNAELVRRVSGLTADPAGDVRHTAWTLLNTWSHGAVAKSVAATLVEHPPALALAAVDPNSRVRSEAQSVATAAGLTVPEPQARQPTTVVAPAWTPGVRLLRAARVVVAVAMTVLALLVVVAVAVVWSLARSAHAHVEADPRVGNRPPGTMVFCVRCRAVLPQTSRFCRRCGLVRLPR